MAGRDVRSCRSCKASVVWAKFKKSGKATPFDALPDPQGKWVLWQEPDGSILARPYDLEAVAKKASRYTNHFSTCPDAPDWRKER